jgi:hypothetical protein
MNNCCSSSESRSDAAAACPGCGRPGRDVERVTLKALLRPAALERLTAPAHRFCTQSDCAVVYFGHDEVFVGADVASPVFQKLSPGRRTVCYCLDITEDDIRREVLAPGHETSMARITRLVKEGRCACELRNPQGTCCLGNVSQVTAQMAADSRHQSESIDGR